MNYREAIERLKSLSDPARVAAMSRFGVQVKKALGISAPELRRLAREIGKDHAMAARLWSSGIHEARILAALIDDAQFVTEGQMESWASDFDSWDVCDACCSNLFDRTPFAYRKAIEWSRREEEYVKRAAFALMAALAVHDKKAADENFVKFLPLIRRESADDRNFVKKAVNWALRQIGKRNAALNRAAIDAAREIQSVSSRSARWIAADALRELTSEKVQSRLRRKSSSFERTSSDQRARANF
ncbi:MAG: DNA alkylation repair protein [Acidobacteriota bacterium]